MAITLFDFVCAILDVDPKVADENIKKFQAGILEAAAELRTHEEAIETYLREGYQILKVTAEQRDFLEDTMTVEDLWEKVEDAKQLIESHNEILKRGNLSQSDVLRMLGSKPETQRIVRLSDLEPPIAPGKWKKQDWHKFFQYIDGVYGKSQPDWKLWANKTGKAHRTIIVMSSKYYNHDLD